jgi:hypothetical protein
MDKSPLSLPNCVLSVFCGISRGILGLVCLLAVR